MLEKQEIKILKKGKYIVEIQSSEKEQGYIDFYLKHIDYGIKTLMFGVSEDINNDTEIINLINANIDEYINIYQKEYED